MNSQYMHQMANRDPKDLIFLLIALDENYSTEDDDLVSNFDGEEVELADNIVGCRRIVVVTIFATKGN